MALIPLTKGHEAIIDDADIEMVMKYKWQAMPLKHGVYVTTRYWDKQKKIYIGMLLHRYLLKAPRHLVTDHKNKNPLDNRRSNLRLCTIRQNLMNKRFFGKKTSKYRGVSFDKERNQWRASAKKANGIPRQVRFKTEIEAAIYYNKLAKKFYGEFAMLNNVEGK